MRPLWIVLATLATTGEASAVSLKGMADFPKLAGVYAPAGNCSRHPQFTVEPAGFRIELDGQTVLADRPEYGASWFGDGYAGIALWFAPWFSDSGGNPISIVFNADEKPGLVTVQAQDFDYRGGPALPQKYRALVAGSPYRRCG